MPRNDNYFELTDKLGNQPNYDAALKVVYQWVKEGYISYQMMGDLNVYLYKKFVY